MRRSLPVLLVAVGLVLIVVGFVYDVAFAGIPYPDPTPKMAAAYARHSDIAAAIRWVGLGVVLAGVAGSVVRQLVHR